MRGICGHFLTISKNYRSFVAHFDSILINNKTVVIIKWPLLDLQFGTGQKGHEWEVFIQYMFRKNDLFLEVEYDRKGNTVRPIHLGSTTCIQIASPKTFKVTKLFCNWWHIEYSSCGYFYPINCAKKISQTNPPSWLNPKNPRFSFAVVFLPPSGLDDFISLTNFFKYCKKYVLT